MLAFEGTDLPEAIILRSMSGGNGIFGAVVPPIGTGGWWFGSAASSGFTIGAPIFQVLPVDARRRTSKTDSGERAPRAWKRRGGVRLQFRS